MTKGDWQRLRTDASGSDQPSGKRSVPEWKHQYPPARNRTEFSESERTKTNQHRAHRQFNEVDKCPGKRSVRNTRIK